MSRRVNSKSITVLVIFLSSIFCTSVQTVRGRGIRAGGGMPVPTNIAKDFDALKTETLEQSVKNLHLVDFFYWPRSRNAGAGGITLPLPESEGQVDVDRIFKNMRFIKIYDELSQIDNNKASKLIINEINETLPLYLKMFADTWDKVYKAHENEPPEQRQTIGPSLQISDEPNGAPTLAGVRYKLLSLVALGGNLKLESTRPAIAKVISEALAQREKFYNPITGFSGDRFSMLIKAGIYNRQILATGILLTSGTPENNSSTDYIDERWETMNLMRSYNIVSLPPDLVSPDYTQDPISAIIHKTLNDEEFDKICQDENIKQALEQYENAQEDNIKIVPVPNQEVLTLDPDTMVQILQKINFTKAQIEKYSYEIHNALAKSGAARILIDGTVEAGLAVKGDEVYISSLNNGYHIYNIKDGWVNATPLR